MFVDNISSYHSVSPADTIIPPCHVPGTRSPSPLPSSRRTSCVSSSSTSASYPGSCPGPSQASGNRHEYDRTKLSIPLQRYFKTKILHFYIKSIKYFHLFISWHLTIFHANSLHNSLHGYCILEVITLMTVQSAGTCFVQYNS